MVWDETSGYCLEEAIVSMLDSVIMNFTVTFHLNHPAAIVGNCHVTQGASVRVGTPTYARKSQTTYSCVANDNCNYDVHVIANYESNGHECRVTTYSIFCNEHLIISIVRAHWRGHFLDPGAAAQFGQNIQGTTSVVGDPAYHNCI